jgi:hypothetical protein
MSAQFSTVNQSRPEEITMKEDLTTISFVGDDSFGMFSARMQMKVVSFDGIGFMLVFFFITRQLLVKSIHFFVYCTVLVVGK